MSQWSLSRKLILSTNSLVAIALVTVGLVVSSKTTSKFKDTMTDQLAVLAEVNASVAAPLVWNLDTANLKALIDRVAGKGSIDGIVFLNEKNELVLNDGAKIEDFGDKPFIEKEMKNEEKPIGKMRLYYNEAIITSARKEAFALTILFVILGQFLVTGGVYWLARSLNKSISAIVNRLQGTSTETTSQSHSLTNSAKTMSDAATSQASAIQETTATLEEMRALGETSASHAKNSYGRAADSYQMTVSARGKMTEMQSYIEKMGKSSEETQEQMRKTNDNMADIVKTITEIKAKTNVINDIVFQTKLLSFNASVEAARAGEHGKGFAVVAEEVGQLASMSGNASKEISQLLDGSLAKVTQLASETKSKAETIARQNQEQMALTEQTASELNIVFDQIVGNNEQVKVMMNEVSTSINEYATGVKNIAEAMLSLDRVTQENADVASKVSSNSATMQEQANILNVVVKDLEGEIFGANGHAIAATAVAPPTSGKPGILKRLIAARSAKSVKAAAPANPTKKPVVATKYSAPAKAVKKPTAAVKATTPVKTTTAEPIATQAPRTSPPKIVPLTKSESKANHSPVAIKKASGDGSTHTSTTDGLSVPSRGDKRFEDL